MMYTICSAVNNTKRSASRLTYPVEYMEYQPKPGHQWRCPAGNICRDTELMSAPVNKCRLNVKRLITRG